FPSLFIFGWFFFISRKHFKLSPVNMKWMGHPSHFIRLIINFPSLSFSLLLCEVNSVWVKFLSIYRYFIHHAIEFHLLFYRYVHFFICNGKVIHLIGKVFILPILI